MYYPGIINTPTADLITIKTHSNSVISTDGSKYMCMDTKYFYLKTPMYHYEYALIKMSMIPDGFMIKYNL